MSPPFAPLGAPDPAVPDPPALDPDPEVLLETPDGGDATATPDDARIIRDLILQAHPDVVPELVQGTTLPELLASLPAAQEAWRNAVERLRQPSDGATPAAPTIPSGASVRSVSLDLDALTPLAKIRAAVG
jgi:hypothetical protein